MGGVVWVWGVLLLGAFSRVLGQAPAPSSTNAEDSCVGILLEYQVSSVVAIHPHNLTRQPYKFEAAATLTNQGYNELKDWQMGISFQHDEILVSAPGAALVDGRSLPAQVGNGTILEAFPASILKNPIETAEDLSQIQKILNLTGTEFGVAKNPLPKTINITNSGYNCSTLSSANVTIKVCCAEVKSTLTVDLNSYLPMEKGNITISYDVTQAYTGNYWAQVTLSNDMPIGRLDHWNLTFDWQEGEFIYKIQGAQTVTADQNLCLSGAAGQQYTSDPDLNQAASCDVTPQIVDLPPNLYNDSTLGQVPYCCRNGTLLPAIIDPSKAKSVFKMNVYKVDPYTDRTHLVPPANWKIGTGYVCGQPRLVSPSSFPDSYGIEHTTSAVQTWQITCNVSTTVAATPKCCVTFSTYYNESIAPCKTCACGCPKNPQPTCDATSPALLMPYKALTLAPENRTSQLVAWASLRHQTVPGPLPCQDYCGVSINWHIVSDYTKGWSARMTLFDWSNETFPDWFAAVELDKALSGLQQAYSFNSTVVPSLNSTELVQGLPGLNYLEAEQNFSAGKLQSVFSFTKQTTPGINIPHGDGFPTNVWFNGEKCALPEMIPTASAWHTDPTALGVILLALFASTFGLLGFL